MSEHEPTRPLSTTTWDEEEATTAGGRHPVNTAHLVMGVAFLGLVAVWAVLAGGVVRLEDAQWLLPLPWLAGGALGLAVSTTRGLRRRH